ncbi:MAG: hypothetical protein WCF10_13925 [Polyangiales bacterium]
MFNSLIKCGFLAAVVLMLACGDAPEYRFGENITGIQFELFDPTEGIHPSKVTLYNPRNPFREVNIGDDTKYDILSEGGNAGAFYAWATLLAKVPVGENQYYTATKLRDIFEANEVPQQDQEIVRQMAINAFQTVLDCFPESVYFDVTGTFPRKLATLSYQEILKLGGAPQGDWTLVQDSNGNLTAVQSTGLDALARNVQCF